ncbi:MAG: recombination protein NinB [Candidatus Obscuribacterales bacterium]|jgi:hypothetical protein
MADKRHFVFAHDTARRQAAAWCMNAPEGYHCRIEPPTRNLEQNAKLWASLTDIAEQVDWYGRKLTPEDWKNVFTASLRKLEVVPNIEGTGFVALGLSTSKMSKREMSDLIELITAFGIEHKVNFKDGFA